MLEVLAGNLPARAPIILFVSADRWRDAMKVDRAEEKSRRNPTRTKRKWNRTNHKKLVSSRTTMGLGEARRARLPEHPHKQTSQPEDRYLAQDRNC
jgi:hypothetical protein